MKFFPTTTFLLLVFIIMSLVDGERRLYERSALVNRDQGLGRLSPRCKFRSKIVVCSHMGRWFKLSMVSTSAIIISVNNNGIRSLDPWIMRRFKNLKYLEVNNNNIESFKGSLVKNRKLEKLLADGNKLGMAKRRGERVLKGAFKSNTKLHTASIRRNGILKLSSVMVDRRNNSMRNLDAAQNHIEQVTKHTVASMGKLETLNLHHNNITFLHKRAFKNNRKLRYLDLGRNRIAFAGWNDRLDITNNRHLLALYLADNRLKSLRDIGMPRNSAMRKLDVAMNRLERIGKNDLIHNYKLLNLNMSFNRIQNVHYGSLRYLKNLHTLDLSGNRLSYLHGSTLRKLRNLKNLYLTYNVLRYLNPKMFVGNNHLVMLDLRGNALLAWQPRALHGKFNTRTLEPRDIKNRSLHIMESEQVQRNSRDSLFVEELDVGSQHRQKENFLRTRDFLRGLQCLLMPVRNQPKRLPQPGTLPTTTFVVGNKPCILIGQSGHVSWQCGCGKKHQLEQKTLN